MRKAERFRAGSARRAGRCYWKECRKSSKTEVLGVWGDATQREEEIIQTRREKNGDIPLQIRKSEPWKSSKI